MGCKLCCGDENQWCDNCKPNLVECKWCSMLTTNKGTEECDSCWELRYRIESDLSLAKKIIKNLENSQSTNKKINYKGMFYEKNNNI